MGGGAGGGRCGGRGQKGRGKHDNRGCPSLQTCSTGSLGVGLVLSRGGAVWVTVVLRDGRAYGMV